jgi:hypothetical protein
MDHVAAPRPSDARSLNVLLIGGFDSTNYAYVELVRELTARGHRCTLVVENERDVVNNKMFINADIPMVPLSHFPLSDLDPVDFVVAGPFLRPQVRTLFAAIYERRKFLVSFANLFSSVTMWIAPDLLVASGENKPDEFARSGLRYAMVAVGNPQYDPLIRARERRPRIALDEIRDVLVVDQGAYPLGETGKIQLAETLIRIARNNPHMTFQVKPRYLPDESGDHLHAVSEHLYNYLPETPDNLVLIRESTILEELILDFDAMITMWSTAHLDAAALGMPLLLIEGFDSVDVFDVRKQRVAAAFEHLRDTGCVVDWRDLQTGPCPFNYVSEEYTREELYDASAPCAPRIVDLLERIDDVLLRHGRTFAGTPQLPYAEFMRDIDRLETLPIRSEENRLNHLLFRKMNPIAQMLAFDNRCLGFGLDMGEMLHLSSRRVAPGWAKRDVECLVEQAREAALRAKAEYFASHPDEVASDVFVQDYYFGWLLDTGRYDELLGYSGPVVAAASLEFNKGLACSKRGRRLQAARHLVESFDISLMKPVRVLKKDKNIRTLLSRTEGSLRTHLILFLMDRHRKYEALSRVDVPEKPGVEALVYYKMKAFVALGQAGDASALYDEYTTAIAHKPPLGRRKGLGQLALWVVIGCYRILLRRYAARLV